MQLQDIFKVIILGGASLLLACNSGAKKGDGQDGDPVVDSASVEYGSSIDPVEPLATEPQNKYAKVIGWPEGKTPVAKAGFKVVKFAADLNSPRNIYVADNGDIFVAQARTEREGEAEEKKASRNVSPSKSPNTILLFRDTDGDGTPDEQFTFLQGLSQPFGMLVLGDYFYVANTDGLVRFPYKAGETTIKAKGEKLVDLPAGGYNNHWTRNLLASKDGKKIYITVGSGTNVAEQGLDVEKRRADILEVNPDGTGERIFAAGLRNPVGVAWEPESGKLWTAVNERDELGDELVPDYITSVKEGGFYGWPFAYWGKNPDPRLEGQREDLVNETIVPDYALGAHTASLGLAFSKGEKFPYGAYIGQHGSWNRSDFVGYKVAFVPFEAGKPKGEVQDFLSGFIANKSTNEVYGRPVGVAFAKSGYLLVADDSANTIWAVLPD
ncbi:PQQ-dependent sugar dehydrogenase [Olivibacter sitiensis]|uniref:PQQ-dependent sugar dehydrogenase n=1 Tax=Olivibacter sitiensis TaxID=376470 RepID=UPI00040BC7D8|nr:sorbosone dehydrogenase family protein [Olivibacter sitiensis]